LLRLIRPQDIIDIMIMSFLVYQLYSWFRNTKALQVVMGLAVLGAIYLVTKQLGLFMTSWILQELGTVLFVLIIVIFQSEIRQALYRFSLLRTFFGRQGSAESLDLAELSSMVFALAQDRVGALIVFERQEPIEEHLLHGVTLDSEMSGQLLSAIFSASSPLHDGAVIIRDGRISQASCHLPLSGNVDLPRFFGTRHRAGIGITERSDAIVLIVSEERGEVSLADSGEIRRITTTEELFDNLAVLLLVSDKQQERPSPLQRILHNVWPKLVIFLLVLAGWILMTAKQGGIVSVTAPVKFRNLPENLSLVRSSPEEVEIQLKVFSGLVSSPRHLDLVADLDISTVREGSNTLTIEPRDVRLPLGVMINGINPSTVKVVMGKKTTKNLRVQLNATGRPAKRFRISVTPVTVPVEGPEHLLDRLDVVETERADLSDLNAGEEARLRLVAPSSELRFVKVDHVTVKASRRGR
jgi:uncharacterized protein (TIGR00159 family)